MKRIRIISVISLFVFIICTVGANQAIAKSVYAITDHYAGTLKAYKIDGDQLQYQEADVNVTNYAYGPVDVTIDSNLELLFITYEDAGKIVWVNAKTLQQEGFTDLSGAPCYAGNLAGIVADEAKQRVYVVGRDSYKLYILAWSTSQKKLILMDPEDPNQPYSSGDPYVSLTDLGSDFAWGISLDENTRRLYVGNDTTNVHIYDANDPNWTHLGSRDVGRPVADITIDPNNGLHPAYLYAGALYKGLGEGHTFLVKHNLETDTNPNTEQNIETVPIGVSVDIDSGLVYVTTSDRQVRVYDCSDPCFICTDSENTGGGSGPAGICVPTGDVYYKPTFPTLTLVKEDNIVDCVEPGDEIIYTITYDANSDSDTNVVIIDYLPDDVKYISSEPEPNEILNCNTIVWKIGTLEPNQAGSVMLTVKVKCPEPCSTITLT